MEKSWIDRIKSFLLVFTEIDKKIGYSKFKRYMILVIIFVLALNYKSIVKSIVSLCINIEQEIHAEKMAARDELNGELRPILAGIRGKLGADRVIYFEYHNTKENVIGIPFKYFELSLEDTEPGIPRVIKTSYLVEESSISVGYITPLYNDMSIGKTIICKGEGDTIFRNRYPGTFEIFNQSDSSQILIFASVPGINRPVGFIVLEWLSKDSTIPDKETIEDAMRHYIPIMNALIVSKS